ncbi:MAG: sulfur carrier protein ThiS [Lentisphaerae bacterium]|nr:sulfur carrier protein ThiS [Lentisphaerota bacterium]
MKLTVNGKAHKHQGGGSLAELLDEIGLTTAHVALIVNDEVIPSSRRKFVRLSEGDNIEIVSFAGGG